MDHFFQRCFTLFSWIIQNYGPHFGTISSMNYILLLIIHLLHLYHVHDQKDYHPQFFIEKYREHFTSRWLVIYFAKLCFRK